MDDAGTRQADPILQAPPGAPRAARLPGTGPVGPHDWILRDEAFEAQMALRDRLVAAGVEGLALRPEAREAALEMLDAVLDSIARDAGYGIVGPAEIRRPDGAVVSADRARPMGTIARLIQEDVCLLQPGPSGHVLTAGALLFPSFWRLEEKLGRSLVSIHAPVDEYDEDVARRVQRLFDAIRPGRPLCRWNWLPYDQPWLHQPRDEADRREATAASPWLRRERQCLLRLPRTGAVAFTIHTFVSRAPGRDGAPEGALDPRLPRGVSRSSTS